MGKIDPNCKLSKITIISWVAACIFLAIVAFSATFVYGFNWDIGIFGKMLDYNFMICGILFAVAIWTTGFDHTTHELEKIKSEFFLELNNLESKIDNIEKSLNDITNTVNKGDIGEIKKILL